MTGRSLQQTPNIFLIPGDSLLPGKGDHHICLGLNRFTRGNRITVQPFIFTPVRLIHGSYRPFRQLAVFDGIRRFTKLLAHRGHGLKCFRRINCAVDQFHVEPCDLNNAVTGRE